MIIKGAESFFLPGGSHGVLLIHGFTGNPAELLLLGKYLQSKNFTVLCMRLAGHGTSEADLIRTTRDDWFNSVLDGFSILSGCCSKISIIGHSMGGILALKAALLLNEKIFRLITLAAPIFINEELGLKFLPEREKCFDLSVHKARRKLKNIPAAANRVYRKMPFISIHELVDLIEDVKANLSKIDRPILIIHGREDKTANFGSANYIYENIKSPNKTVMLIEHAGHLLPLVDERESVFEMASDFLQVE